MTNFSSRRMLLQALAALPLLHAGRAFAQTSGNADPWSSRFATMERSTPGFEGRLGVFALDTLTGASMGYRADERFPFCSTFKAILAGAILRRSEQVPGLLQQRISYTKRDLIAHSPVTEKHLARGMTVAQLCAATVQYSDNAAANLLMRILGGPKAVTAFARTIGDNTFRLDRWETELNTAIPDDPRDTTTPVAMTRSLHRLSIGDALPAVQRAQLVQWLRGNTTGATRIQAGVPGDWQVGDKTGTGLHGSASDIAVVWPPHRAPLVITIYTTQKQQDAKANDAIIAAAASVVAEWIVGTEQTIASANPILKQKV